RPARMLSLTGKASRGSSPHPLPPAARWRGTRTMELARNLKTDSVSRLQPTEARKVAPAQTVAEAVALMRRYKVGCLLVCEGRKWAGIFPERALPRRVLAPGLPLTVPVSACLTPVPVTVGPKESISTAIRRMEEGGYRHLPVVDASGVPLGVLSAKRVI